MWDTILEALLDTLKIVPILFVLYILIEIIEHRATAKKKMQKLLSGAMSPLIGTAVGTIPQCGFSVVSTNLYVKKSIPLSALISVYIATSDEALPIMLSSVEGLKRLWPLLLIKISFALAAGYALFLIEKAIKRKQTSINTNVQVNKATEIQNFAENEINQANDVSLENQNNEAETQHESEDCGHIGCGCHTHKGGHEKESNWQKYFKHPVEHTLTVSAYILAVNLILGIIIYFVTQEALETFLQNTGYAQPFLAALVGIIPNCAGSVLITQLYVSDALSLGAAVAGLCVSAGVGYAVLIKDKKNIVKNLSIIIGMYLMCSLFGVILTAVGL